VSVLVRKKYLHYLLTMRKKLLCWHVDELFYKFIHRVCDVLSLSLSRFSVSVKILICMVVTTMFVPSVMHSQFIFNCPPGYTIAEETYTFPWNGQCCSVKVRYCYKVSSNTLHLEMGTYELIDPTGCWGLDQNAAIPISSLYNHIRKKLVKLHAGLGSYNIPNCPEKAVMVLDERTSQCYSWLTYSDPDGGGLKTVAGGCDDNKCRRICEVCISAQLDPCTQEPLVHIGPCTDYGVPVPCPNIPGFFPNDCQRVTCGS